MRLGLFGGTFDPPHLGHQAIAHAAAERFGLGTVLWAPAGRQPLKRDRSVSSFADRLHMVKLVCGADPRFQPCDLDAPREDGQPNYTADTLRRLHAEQPQAEIFALAGADSFADLGRWREPAVVLELARWIVVSRPGYPLREPDGLELTPAQRARVYLLDSVHQDISATVLRARLAAGDRCRDVLAPAVADYISTRGLYRPVSPEGERVP